VPSPEGEKMGGRKLYYSLRPDAVPGDLDKIVVTEG
jgi:hypothetical protein